MTSVVRSDIETAPNLKFNNCIASFHATSDLLP